MSRSTPATSLSTRCAAWTGVISANTAQRRLQTFKTIPVQMRAPENHSPFRYSTLGRDFVIASRSRLGRGLRRRPACVTRARLVRANPIFSSSCSPFGQLFDDGVAGAEVDFIGRLTIESCMRERRVVFLDVERDQLLESRKIAEVVDVKPAMLEPAEKRLDHAVGDCGVRPRAAVRAGA